MTASGPGISVTKAVAQVVIDSSVPHLDRIFDYHVPEELDAAAQPGVRVQVRFAGRKIYGYLISRSDHSTAGRSLTPISRVVTELPVLTPELLRLCRTVADRYAGTLSDVLRAAIPPRVAKVEQEFVQNPEARENNPVARESNSDTAKNTSDTAENSETGNAHAQEVENVAEAAKERGDAVQEPSFAGYPHATLFLQHLQSGDSPRAVLGSLKGTGDNSWTEQIAAAISACDSSGRGAVVVVPDHRDLSQLLPAVTARVAKDRVAVLTADQGKTARYRAFLEILTGEKRIVLGTRAAAFAPVRNPGLFCCWDDADELLIEPRAPYQHAREVLLLRAEQEHAAMLIAGNSRSTGAQRLLHLGWAKALYAERATVRQVAPRVVSTQDSYETARDHLSGVVRIPERAFQTAKEALHHGPVLVQVARKGYTPALACTRCRQSARCPVCAGPLQYRQGRSPDGSAGLRSRESGRQLSCGWCGTVQPEFHCGHCGGTQLRATRIGSERTAEELGRAFPGISVISSAGEHIRTSIPDAPALVIATPGAEPVAPSGYQAALLLDGDLMLHRESLRAPEEAVRRWFRAAALVRSAADGGTVVITAGGGDAVAALVRWDPAGFAEREYQLRHQLGLPPAVRLVALTGSLPGVESLRALLSLPEGVRVVGPAAVEATSMNSAPGDDSGAEYDTFRVLLFVPYALAAEVLQEVKAAKAEVSSAKTARNVQVRCDGIDIL